MSLVNKMTYQMINIRVPKSKNSPNPQNPSATNTTPTTQKPAPSQPGLVSTNPNGGSPKDTTSSNGIERKETGFKG